MVWLPFWYCGIHCCSLSLKVQILVIDGKISPLRCITCFSWILDMRITQTNLWSMTKWLRILFNRYFFCIICQSQEKKKSGHELTTCSLHVWCQIELHCEPCLKWLYYIYYYTGYYGLCAACIVIVIVIIIGNNIIIIVNSILVSIHINYYYVGSSTTGIILLH